jgi:hypothetical protein
MVRALLLFLPHYADSKTDQRSLMVIIHFVYRDPNSAVHSGTGPSQPLYPEAPDSHLSLALLVPMDG